MCVRTYYGERIKKSILNNHDYDNFSHVFPEYVLLYVIFFLLLRLWLLHVQVRLNTHRVWYEAHIACFGECNDCVVGVELHSDWEATRDGLAKSGLVTRTKLHRTRSLSNKTAWSECGPQSHQMYQLKWEERKRKKS